MPPTAKVTREMILSAALDITRREGFDAVNARSLAARLGCSTRPIFFFNDTATTEIYTLSLHGPSSPAMRTWRP